MDLVLEVLVFLGVREGLTCRDGGVICYFQLGLYGF